VTAVRRSPSTFTCGSQQNYTYNFWIYLKLNTFNRIYKIIFSVGCILIPFIVSGIFLTHDNFPGHSKLRFWLDKKLVRTRSISGDFNKAHPLSHKIIYILGGHQHSLISRFKTAAVLYEAYDMPKINILSRPGITEYDLQLKRNLTNDEWAIKRLEEFGITNNNIQPLMVTQGCFGTLAEARGVSQEVVRKGYDVLILVTSSYHTARVFESFSKYLKGTQVTFFVYGSNDSLGLWGLILEYVKLQIYKYILL